MRGALGCLKFPLRLPPIPRVMPPALSLGKGILETAFICCSVVDVFFPCRFVAIFVFQTRAGLNTRGLARVGRENRFASKNRMLSDQQELAHQLSNVNGKNFSMVKTHSGFQKRPTKLSGFDPFRSPGDM